MIEWKIIRIWEKVRKSPTFLILYNGASNKGYNVVIKESFILFFFAVSF